MNFFVLIGLGLGLIFPASISVPDNQQIKGSLVIIGGALKRENKVIYGAFIKLGGGKKKIKIAIIPAASSTPVKSGNAYRNNFIDYGVPSRQIKLFPVALKDDPATPDIDESGWAKNAFNAQLANEIGHYNGIFLVGGDQMRYFITLIDPDGKDSPMLNAIRRIYEKGGVIAGTSAGAAVMSDPMIIGCSSIEAVTVQKIPFKKGFGFFYPGIVDQHFIKRGRIGRLITALLLSREISLGFGIDEDTALVLKKNLAKVIGSSGVIVIDTKEVKSSRNPAGIAAQNILLHYLEAGDSLDLSRREITVHPLRKKILPGKEYFQTYPLNTNIFGRDIIKEVLTTGLVDNEHKQVTGLSFILDEQGNGRGTKFVFSQQEDSAGYWGKIGGQNTYTVTRVHLDISPISVTIREINR